MTDVTKAGEDFSMSSVTLEAPQPQPQTQTDADALTVLAPLPESGRSVGGDEIVRIAFDSLLANKARSLLTMLGVIIGVAAVV